jgi:hypothetical protein
MATSMAAAIAASMPEKQAAPSSAPTTVATHEAIPASMAKVMDVEAEIPLASVELDGLVSLFPWLFPRAYCNELLAGRDEDHEAQSRNRECERIAAWD